jgi:hypothetical protein
MKNEETQGSSSSSIDLASAKALLGKVLDAQNSYVENLHKILDKSLRGAELHAGFYEKLILFDVGTIALSLTLLGQIIARTPGGHVPEHPFVWFLCPAWFLLLLSVYFCAHRIIAIHNIVTNQVRQMSNSASGCHLNQLRTLIADLSKVVGGVSISDEQAKQLNFAPPTGGSSHTLADVFSNINAVLIKTLNQETEDINKFMTDSIQQDKRTGILARLAFASTTVALVFICIFAIKSILLL